MKKLFVLIAFAIASVSVASAQGWGIGGRLGTDLQVVGQKYLASDNYWELRLGYTPFHQGNFDASLLYVWNVRNWDWTPGNWFLDIGAGANVGFGGKSVFVGVQAMGKFGYTFENVPLSLSFDVSPALGPIIRSKNNGGTNLDWARGLANGALSVVYRF
jgi:hypothetical protein